MEAAFRAALAIRDQRPLGPGVVLLRLGNTFVTAFTRSTLEKPQQPPVDRYQQLFELHAASQNTAPMSYPFQRISAMTLLPQRLPTRPSKCHPCSARVNFARQPYVPMESRDAKAEVTLARKV